VKTGFSGSTVLRRGFCLSGVWLETAGLSLLGVSASREKRNICACTEQGAVIFLRDHCALFVGNQHVWRKEKISRRGVDIGSA